MWLLRTLFSIDILKIDWLKVVANSEETSIVWLSIKAVGWLKERRFDVIRSDVMLCLLVAFVDWGRWRFISK
jgi:hypothetical protein